MFDRTNTDGDGAEDGDNTADVDAPHAGLLDFIPATLFAFALIVLWIRSARANRSARVEMRAS